MTETVKPQQVKRSFDRTVEKLWKTIEREGIQGRKAIASGMVDEEPGREAIGKTVNHGAPKVKSGKYDN